MRLIKIRLHGFGKYRDHTLTFRPGLQIFRGPNEEGKSTVVNAILAALYGLHGGRKYDREIKERYRPWESSVPYKVTLKIEDSSCSQYLIERDFDNNRSSFYKLQERTLKPLNDISGVLDNLGLPTLPLFQSTLLVSQKEVAVLDRSKLGEAISGKVTEGSEEIPVTAVLKKLEKRLYELEKKGRTPRAFGEIQSVDCEISELENKMREVEKYEDELQKMKASLQEIEEEIQKEEQFCNDYRPVIKKHHRFLELQKELEIFKDREKKLMKKVGDINKTQKEIQNIRRELEEQFGRREKYYTPQMREKLEALYSELKIAEKDTAWVLERQGRLNIKQERLKIKLEGIKAELSGNYSEDKCSEEKLLRARQLNVLLESSQQKLRQLESELEHLGSNFLQRDRLAVWGAAIMVISLSPPVWTYSHLAGFLLALAGVLLLGTLFWRRIRFQKKLADRERILKGEKRVCLQKITELAREFNRLSGGKTLDELSCKFRKRQRLLERYEELNGELEALRAEEKGVNLEDTVRCAEDLRKRLFDFLEKAGCGSVEEYKNKLSAYLEKRQRLEVMSQTLDSLLEEKELSQWEDQAWEAAGRVRELQKEIKRNVVDVEAVEVYKYENQLHEKEKRLEELLRKRERCEERLRSFSDFILKYDRIELKASLNAARSRREELRLKRAGLTKAVTLIREVYEEFQNQLVPALEQEVNAVLASVTRGRYRDVKINAKTRELSISVKAPENGYVKPEYLSTGTLDLLYMALRIGVGSFLCRTPEYPLIMDDPFVNFDFQRLEKMAFLLREISRNHQVIWFTKDEQVGELLGSSFLRYLPAS